MSEHDPSAQEKRSLGERIRRLYLAVRRHGFTVLLLAMGVAITAMVRYTLLEYRSADMDGFILPWCDAIAKKGFAGAFKDGGIDYNPTYIYFLWIAAKLPVDRMLAVKAFTIFCDYASALIMALTIRRLCQSWLRALLGAFALLLAPTVVFNGALWGQCDMLYSLLLLWGLAFFVRGHAICQ